MPTNSYFSNGTRNEQLLVEDLIIESIQIWGQDFFYLPRKLVARDQILGEDRLSEFKNAFEIEMYLESNSGFEGTGAFIQKFGLFMEQSATLTVSVRRWDQLVNRKGKGLLPSRPAEGDLLWFPLTDNLLEIKFVQHQDPFYQLGQLPVFRLNVENFQYSSEKIETGMPQIDAFETLKTYDVDPQRSIFGVIKTITVTHSGSGYFFVPEVYAVGNYVNSAELIAVMGEGPDSDKVVAVDILNPGIGYATPPQIVIQDSPTFDTATAVATIEVDPDIPGSYGDNTKFKNEFRNVKFNEDNPFGELE